MPGSRNCAQTDSFHNIEGNGNFKEWKLKESSLPSPTMMYIVNGPNTSLIEIVNVAPRKGQIPVSFKSGADWEAPVIPKNYSTGKKNLMVKEKFL